MNRERAREVLRQAEQVVKSEPVYGGRPAEEVRQEALAQLMTLEELHHVGGLVVESDVLSKGYVSTTAEVLRRIAAGPDGWPAGTVVQARGVAPGPLNRWIVAQGPIPAEYGVDSVRGEDAVILIDESILEQDLEGGTACWDYYDARSFEPA